MRSGVEWVVVRAFLQRPESYVSLYGSLLMTLLSFASLHRRNYPSI
jgi:hypothetical protein